MRETLEEAVRLFENTCELVARAGFTEEPKWLKQAKDALAEPKQNFERFDTAREAQEAFCRLCNGRHSCGPHCWYHPADLNEACSFRWLYDTKPHDWSDMKEGGKA
jgi:hypothetical protein